MKQFRDGTYYKYHNCQDCGGKFFGHKQKRCVVCKAIKMEKIANQTKDKRAYYERKKHENTI